MEPAPQEEPPPSVQPTEESKRAGRNLPLAIITGLTLAGLLFGTLFWKPVAFPVLATAVLLLALQEFYSALTKRGYRPATALGLVGGGLVLVGAYWKGPQALSFGVVLTLVGAYLWYLVDPERDRVATNISVTVLGVAYVAVLGSHAILIRDMPQGIAHTIAFIGAVAFYDIGAYASGSLFGKHKIAPDVSPSKTWEGALGATIFVFVCALLIGPHLGHLDAGSSALLAAATVILAPLGDLTESMLKRDLDIKDMGTLLPGHGGALDRVDALLFTAPAAYWIFRSVVS